MPSPCLATVFQASGEEITLLVCTPKTPAATNVSHLVTLAGDIDSDTAQLQVKTLAYPCLPPPPARDSCSLEAVPATAIMDESWQRALGSGRREEEAL